MHGKHAKGSSWSSFVAHLLTIINGTARGFFYFFPGKCRCESYLKLHLDVQSNEFPLMHLLHWHFFVQFLSHVLHLYRVQKFFPDTSYVLLFYCMDSCTIILTSNAFKMLLKCAPKGYYAKCLWCVYIDMNAGTIGAVWPAKQQV